MDITPSRRTLIGLAFFAVYFIWGTTYLAIRYALTGFGPFTISALRYLAAGLILAFWMWLRKTTWPQKKDMRVLVISGILMLSGGSGLVVVGEQYISSGFAAVIVATEPLFFVLFDRKRWHAYFSSRWIIIGLLAGFTGITLFACLAPTDLTLTHPHPVLGTLITLLSAMSWVAGTLYANHKLSPGTSNLPASAVQLLGAGLLSGLVAGGRGEWQELLRNAVPIAAWGGLVYLIVMGSLVAYLSFNWLITVQPPAIVSTHTYVNPIIAIFMGWLVATEPVSWLQLCGLAIALGGVIITQSNKQQILRNYAGQKEK